MYIFLVDFSLQVKVELFNLLIYAIIHWILNVISLLAEQLGFEKGNPFIREYTTISCLKVRKTHFCNKMLRALVAVYTWAISKLS